MEKLAGSLWTSLPSSGDHPHSLHCHLSLSALRYNKCFLMFIFFIRENSNIGLCGLWLTAGQGS